MSGSEHHIQIDSGKRLAEQPTRGHNRWHPEIPPVLRVDAGDRVTIETLDAFDGQITPDSSAGDIRAIDLNLVHPLTGPVYVNGAEPGDLLEVRLLGVKPADFGYTILVPGFGFLRDEFPEPFIVKWEIANGYAHSADLPGVRISGAPFPGTIGLAPSRRLLAEITNREQALAATGGFVLTPASAGAVPSAGRPAAEGLRTIPPREIAGNLDIKQLTAGAKLFVPVSEQGALFSIGDAHFAQGDSECCGTAIEMNAAFDLEFHLLKGEARRRSLRRPEFSHDSYMPPDSLAGPRRFYATTGMSITREGQNRSEDVTLAVRDALLNMIDYLQDRYGYSREQSYALCSVAVDLKVSELVDVPNVTVSAFLPLDVFI
ncbi:MAG TPA: acetamidase/formamidase family protein [Candidatus Binataceae bacterium]|nr:acetamidase/formamidase family protein [Candidatus Binataceae bacterium]